MATPETIIDLRVNEKLTMRGIAARCGISHERVRQILQAHDIDTRRLSMTKRPRKVRVGYELDPERVQKIYGCTLDEVREIQDGVWLSAANSPARLYKIHRKRYRENPGWELTFPQWWDLWRLRWRSRDTKQLVMVPADPAQPMSTDNATIITRKELMVRHWKDRKAS
ncbi:sigma factor-like helix-turn-helix DNA-binding protein [Luteimonas sp. SDU101]|uniref:sigma factor-like helix-turn-helix DNA-binding protein n=1 Tax=Luteimonas sp. SDU101 TaxID=3422593 RepID=UPI003EC0C345